MDVQTRWMPMAPAQTETMQQRVDALLQRQLQIWWSCKRELPAFTASHSEAERRANDAQLKQLVRGLVYECKHPAISTDGRAEQQRRLRSGALPFLGIALALEERHIDFIENSGLLQGAQTFARMARAFDPNIRTMDIYQASRNVMTMNFLQILLALPLEVTPSVFAYSMLYPYTDNYLDDPAVDGRTKLAFNQRFARRLQGEIVRPANATEEIINELVGMIEQEWDRARYPQVFESLLAIHKAQGSSMQLVAPDASPYELDVLGVSFEKGGTSVLADGYLVAGDLTPEQARLAFAYGSFTQLMDDLEDLEDDLRQGSMSIFSQTARHWPLDGLMNRVFWFGKEVFADLSGFPGTAAPMLKELIERCIDPILIDSAARMGAYYRKPYLRALEQSFPFRFAEIARQRAYLQRHKIAFDSLFGLFFVEPPAR